MHADTPPSQLSFSHLGTASGGRLSSSTSASPAVTINRLRSDLRAASNEIEDLKREVKTLQSMIVAKDEAIDAGEAAKDAAMERALNAEGEAASLRRNVARVEKIYAKTVQERDEASAEADRLSQKLSASADIRAESGGAAVAELYNQLGEVSDMRQSCRTTV